jgi:hypothetical protein
MLGNEPPSEVGSIATKPAWEATKRLRVIAGPRIAMAVHWSLRWRRIGGHTGGIEPGLPPDPIAADRRSTE